MQVLVVTIQICFSVREIVTYHIVRSNNFNAIIDENTIRG